MSVEEVSAEELAGLDFDDDGTLVDAAIVEDAPVGAVAEGEAEEAEDLGFEEDAPAQTVDAYMEAAADASEAGAELAEAAHYSLAAEADGEEEDEEEEEEEEEEEKAVDEVEEPEEVVAQTDEPVAAAAGEAVDEGDGDDIMFFEDTAADATASPPTVEDAQPAADEPGEVAVTQEVCVEATVQLGPCAVCGLPGHASEKCPFGHGEDIQLGDMEESDSDDELPETYPMLARYVSQHVGALIPKNKKGLTGGGRFFGEDKPHRQCWVCGAEDHESNDCSLKRCFFCGEPGHDSRGCSEKTKICSHCRCKGHHPVMCPTLVSQELVSFASTHCLSCGGLGHANCGPPPGAVPRPPLPQMLSLKPMLPTSVGRPQLPPGHFQRPPPPLFNLGLPPPTPTSGPPTPMGSPRPGMPGSPADAFHMARPSLRLPPPRPPGLPPQFPAPVPFVESKSASTFSNSKSASVLGAIPGEVQSKAAAAHLNGTSATKAPQAAARKPTAVKSPGKALGGRLPNVPGNIEIPNGAPVSKSGKAPVSKVLGTAPISKVPGKAAITKTPGKAIGKAPIMKVPGKAPIAKNYVAGNPAALMKSSAKRPSTGGAPSPKRAKSNNNGW